MPTPLTDQSQPGGQQLEWSETLHAFLFRARIYLKRYWWVFLLTISAGIGLQAWRQVNSKPVYESHAKMTLRARVQTAMDGTVVAENSVGFYPTQMATMMDDRVLNTAALNAKAAMLDLKDPNPTVDPHVMQQSGTDFLLLSVTGSDPAYTTTFLDAWMNAYLDYKLDQRNRYITEAENAEQLRAASWKTQMDKYEADKAAFNKENNIAFIENSVKSAGLALADLESAQSIRQRRLAFLNSLDFNGYIDGNHEVVDVTDSRLAANNFAPADSTYYAEKQNLFRAQALYKDLSPVLRPRHELMQALAAEIARKEKQLATMRKQTVDALQLTKTLLTDEVARGEEDLKEARARANHFQDLENRFNDLNARYEIAYKAYLQATTTTTAIDVSKLVDQPMMEIFNPASTAVPITPNKFAKLGEGALIGLVAGAIIIFLLGALDGRVMSVEDLTQRFDEPMLGVIPMQKRIGGRVELLQTNDQRQMFAEACRNIRSSLLYMDRQGQRPRTIVLTSSIPAEGKSTLSANLSITLGFAASRTLLVDADLRRGQLHKQFGLSNELGLAEHIQDGVPIDKVIQPTGFENLDFIPCGHYPAQPGELLMSERFRETLQVLRQRYDFIIFDSPPILATDDAGSFATRNDAVIFVVRAGYTRLRQVRTSLESLHRRGVKIYGLIVNFIDHREPGYYSYKYYDYYSYRPGGAQPERASKSPGQSPAA